MTASKAKTRALARWGQVVLGTFSVVAGLLSVQGTNQTATKPGGGTVSLPSTGGLAPGPISGW